eukprot:1102714-Rhodomonas_salina.2
MRLWSFFQALSPGVGADAAEAPPTSDSAQRERERVSVCVRERESVCVCEREYTQPLTHTAVTSQIHLCGMEVERERESRERDR